MNNVFSKLSLALCFVFVSVLGFSQGDGCNYTIQFIDISGDGSDGAQLKVTLNQGESRTFTIPGGASATDIDLFAVFGRSKVRGGSTIQIEHIGPMASDHQIFVTNALGDSVFAKNYSSFQTANSADPIVSGTVYNLKTTCIATTCEQDSYINGVLKASCTTPGSLDTFLTVAKPVYCLSQSDSIPSVSLELSQDGDTIDVTFDIDLRSHAITNIVGRNPGAITPTVVGDKIQLAISAGSLAALMPGKADAVLIYSFDDEADNDTLEIAVSVIGDNPSASRLVANDQVNVSLGLATGCSKILQPDDVLENFTPCMNDATLEIQILDLFRRPVYYDEDATQVATDSLVGLYYDARGNVINNNKFIYTVKNIVNNTLAWGYVLIEDKQAPIFDLPDGEITCNHPLIEDILAGRERRDFRYNAFLDADFEEPFTGSTLETGESVELFFNVTFCDDLYDQGVDCLENEDRNLAQGVVFLGNQLLLSASRNPDNDLTITSATGFTSEGLTPRIQAEDLCRTLSLTIQNNAAESFSIPSNTSLIAQARYAYRQEGDIDFLFYGSVAAGIFEASNLNPLLRAPWVQDCAPRSLEFINAYIENGDCPGGSSIVRQWKVTDASGRSATARQRIRLTRPNINDLVQDDSDITLSCVDNNINDLRGNADGISPIFDCNFVDLDEDYAACRVTYTFKDGQVFDGCGSGAGKFIREWTIVDWCTGASRSFSQFIEVTDDLAPVVEDVTISVKPSGTAAPGKNSCVSDVEITVDAADRGCSGFYTIVEFTETVAGYQGGAGTRRSVTFRGATTRIEDVPVSPVPVNFTITVVDSCGNAANPIVRSVNVIDQDAPICKVDDKLNVSLDSRGQTVIKAIDIDEGTTDNCGIDRFEVSLDRITWGPTVTFNCASQGDIVYFKAIDIYGNECEEWMNVLYEDAVPPIFQRPRNITVDCKDPRLNTPNFSGFATPTVTDNCGGVIPEAGEFFVSEKDKCGGFFIVRNYSADDASPKTGTVRYRDTIFVEPSNDGYTLQFPKDTTIRACIDGIPESDVIIVNNSCRTIYKRVTDHRFKNANGACYEIHRTFEVIDWCILDTSEIAIEDADGDLGTVIDRASLRYNGDTDGYQVYVQKIAVIDEQAPVFTGGNGLTNDTILIERVEECRTRVDFSIVGQDACAESVSYSYVVTRDGSTVATGTTNRFNAEVPSFAGLYKITWTIDDGCGNRATTMTHFRSVDTKKPTPVAINLNSTVMQMGQGGQVEIWASDFIKEVTDNCTNWTVERWREAAFFKAEDGTFQKGKTFTCADLGRNDVRVYVGDADGNINFVTVTFFVQDNGGFCGSGSGSIAGSVKTDLGTSISDVQVALNTDVVVATSEAGAFSFANLEEGKSYTINATKNGGARNGVRTDDILLVVKHLLGDAKFDSPYKYFAADANNDGKVSPADLVSIRNVILGNTAEFPNNTSWRFLDKEYAFGSNDPLNEDFPQGVEIKSLTGSNQANFIGVKVGDINGDAVATLESRTGKTVNLSIEEATINAGSVYNIEVKASDLHTANAYQFTMNLGNLEVVDVKAGVLDVNETNFGFAHINDGILTTAWDSNNGIDVNAGDVLFTVAVKATENVRLSDVFDINSRITEAVAFVNEGEVRAADIDVTFENAGAETVLFQNTPNPFATETLISFNLANAGEATITVFDMAGKVVTMVTGNYAAGLNNVTLNKAQLNASGVLYYQLETANFAATKKMVVLK